jgi:cytochrome c-type biogenesis protein
MSGVAGLTLLDYPVAFAAGLVSFGSPCVLGLVPGYLSFVSGVSYDELGARPRNIIWPVAAFVAGFTAIFTLMGASAGLIGVGLRSHGHLINQIGGTLLILMGIGLLLFPRLGLLQREHKVHLTRRPTTLAGSSLVGAAFAAGWTPCIGPIYGAILLRAGPTGSPGIGATLLFTYAIGLGVPFLLAGLFFTRALSAFTWVRRHWTAVNVTAAVLTIGVGILMATQQLERITRVFSGIGFQGI